MEVPQTNQTDSAFLLQMVEQIQREIQRVVVGQHEMTELLLAGLLADGHILIEGVPGVAKTLTAKLLARLIDAQFSRLQFTPDLMPSDVLGSSVFNPQTVSFQFKPGPIFANTVLIDEINRAPAKTQAALFEVMEERQVTVDGHTHKMQQPFMVIATQNPIEHEGTYRLPEAQLDRFLMKIVIGYPSLEEEVRILEMHNKEPFADLLARIRPVIPGEVLLAARQKIQRSILMKTCWLLLPGSFMKPETTVLCISGPPPVHQSPCFRSPRPSRSSGAGISSSLMISFSPHPMCCGTALA